MEYPTGTPASEATRSTFVTELDRLENLIAEALSLAGLAEQSANRLSGLVPAKDQPGKDPRAPESDLPHLMRLVQASDRLQDALSLVGIEIGRIRETIG